MNPHLANVKPSLTLELSALAKQFIKEGKDVVNLSAGEPDFDTPVFIKDKIAEALDKKLTKYMPSSGLPVLKEAISRDLKGKGMDYPASGIIVAPGAKFSVFSAIFSLVDKGDEVIIISPYWVSYLEMVHICGAVPVMVKTSASSGYQPYIGDVKKALTDKTRLIIINSPSNPTGKILGKDFLKELLEVTAKTGVFILSDEIYDRIVFDGNDCPHIGALSGGDNSRIIVVNGASKCFSMTGLRIGWSASAPEVSSSIAKFQSHTTSCATSICQYAVAAALGDPERDKFYSFIREEFQKRRDILCEELRKVEKVSFFKPEGAFYAFVDIREVTDNSLDFSRKLLEKSYVACVPGEAFGEKGFIRMSLSEKPQRLREAAKRLKEFSAFYV